MLVYLYVNQIFTIFVLLFFLSSSSVFKDDELAKAKIDKNIRKKNKVVFRIVKVVR